MLSLRSVQYIVISKWMRDFQKHAKDYDMPSDTSQFIGIYNMEELIGYFVVQGYDRQDVEVQQGYLKAEYRHLDLSKQCMQLLEQVCKQDGYKNMVLATGSRFQAYFKFAKGLGYKPKHLEFSKEL